MANFTEYFSQYLKNHELPVVLDTMPVDATGKSFKERFIERNYYKEIGSETEELFEMHLNIRSNEVVEEYSWKIKLFNENYEKLMIRYIETYSEINDTYSGTDSTNGDNKDYLNPIDNNSDTLNNRFSTESSLTYGKHLNKKINNQHAVSWARSNPEIMKAALELKDIYDEALSYMDNLFMVIL